MLFYAVLRGPTYIQFSIVRLISKEVLKVYEKNCTMEILSIYRSTKRKKKKKASRTIL